MTTKTSGVLLVLITTFLTSGAQIFLKLGAEKANFSPAAILSNYSLITGIFLYIIAAVLAITAFRHGDVSVLYPIFATSYVWVALLSYYFLGEIMGFAKWTGIALIICGISILGTDRGSVHGD